MTRPAATSLTAPWIVLQGVTAVQQPAPSTPVASSTKQVGLPQAALHAARAHEGRPNMIKQVIANVHRLAAIVMLPPLSDLVWVWLRPIPTVFYSDKGLMPTLPVTRVGSRKSS